MSGRRPKRFVEQPVDPRSRKIIAAIKTSSGVNLDLECGHCVHRRVRFHPTAVICPECQPAGGMRRGFK